MYKKHSIEERLLAVKKCLEGYAPKGVAKELGLNEHDISEWLLRYKMEGVLGLQKRPIKHADFEEKCKIVCEYAEKGVSLHRVCAKYHVSQAAVSRWTRIYRQGGYEALQEPQTELERLRYENEYLRAEVALLKKVRALVEEREKRLHEIGRKPSKH